MTIADYVRNNIDSKKWLPGEVIPNETALGEYFNASRPTVRAALTKLEAEGIVKRIKGKGTIVQPQFKLHESTLILESFKKIMQQKGLNVITNVITFDITKSSNLVAQKLDISPGEEVIRLFRLRYIEDKFDTGPMVYSESYSSAKFDFLFKYDMTKVSFVQTLNDNGIFFNEGEKILRPVTLSDEQSDLMGVPSNSLALLFETVWKDTQGKYAEYSRAFWPILKNEFRMKISQ